MSYDFVMMKPRVEIHSQHDLGEDALLKQEPAALVSALSAMFPSLAWRREDNGGWFAALDGEDSWYEFSIDSAPNYTWSIRTSHRTQMRSLIAPICGALAVIAFDGQAMVIIGPDGERPA